MSKRSLWLDIERDIEKLPKFIDLQEGAKLW